MVHFHLNQLAKGIVSKCSHLLSHRGKGLNTGVWGPGAGTGARRGQGSSGGGEGPAGQQGARWGEGTTQPSPSQGGWAALLCQGYKRGTREVGRCPNPATLLGVLGNPLLLPGTWPKLFPTPTPTLNSPALPAAHMWTVHPRRYADTAAPSATTCSLRYCSRFAQELGAAHRRGFGQHACRLSVAFPSC